MDFILKYKKQFIIGGVLSLFLIVSSVVYYTMSDNNKSNKDIVAKTEVTFKEQKNITDEEKQDKAADNIVTTEYYVDIKGAINKPGVYKLNSNSIVNDVIALAEGITKDGDTTCINLSKKITDEMVIYIYTKDETKDLRKKEEKTETSKNYVCTNITNDSYVNPDESNVINNKDNNNVTNETEKNETETKVDNTSDKININTADINTLSALPNIGESKAKDIIEYRNIHGNFNVIEEIKEVSGIGEATFQKIKDLITV